MAGRHIVRLLRRKTEATGTESFFFERPEDFDFVAGQYLEMMLIDPALDPDQSLHSFSISSPPREPEISITTRMRASPFKQSLSRLTPGETVEIDGPYGSFCPARESRRPLALIAGGIGVTPMRSMIAEGSATAGLAGVVLFYSNRKPEEAAFLEELAEVAAHQDEFKLVATMSDVDPDGSPWPGERGRISLEMIARHVPIDEATFFISGPPPMVSGISELLAGAGVPRDRVKVERFDGY